MYRKVERIFYPIKKHTSSVQFRGRKITDMTPNYNF